MLKGHLMMHISLDPLSVCCVAMQNRLPVHALRHCILNSTIHSVCVMLMLLHISGLASEQQLCNFSNGLQFTKSISTICACLQQ
jgi:hypothetical protein